VADEKEVTPAARSRIEIDPDDLVALVGSGWRELRRGASMQALRERIYQGDHGLIDLGLADALEVIDLIGPCRMRELADALRVDPSTATRTVDRLVEKELAERIADEADARRVLVGITPEGQKLRDRVRDQARAAVAEILEEFSEAEARQLASLMSRLVVAVDRYVDGSAPDRSAQNSSDR
jgi:DNA-binding MarR family transcriptional regulator